MAVNIGCIAEQQDKCSETKRQEMLNERQRSLIKPGLNHKIVYRLHNLTVVLQGQQ